MAKESSPNAITAVSVKGFKSFAKEQRIEICPLTILAGANSSGKSSVLQPLLLLKQTMDASYDPGTLLLEGPHVQFTSAEQMLTRIGPRLPRFEIAMELLSGGEVRAKFGRAQHFGFFLEEMGLALKDERVTFDDSDYRLDRNVTGPLALILRDGFGFDTGHLDIGMWALVQRRCFYDLVLDLPVGRNVYAPYLFPVLTDLFGRLLGAVIHLPRMRGNPERSYSTAGVGELFSGTFEKYVASIIASWQESSDGRLGLLGEALQSLGLTWGIQANPIDATRVEILVGRLPKRPKSSRGDLVNIADVGFGVSQVLPVLVALLTAEPGQLVYIEQPELHLHPRAEQALAPILAEAASRGVRVVVETHSAILLIAIQALVAEDKLSPDLLKLHWFQRDSRGATRVISADLDERGAYGDWPVDFYSVERDVTDRYLDAVETKFFSKTKNA